MDLVPHLLEHALEDTLYLVPFLLVTYLLLEILEHKAGAHTEVWVRKAGIAGPLVGALLGAVPQCGFSAAGSALYASRAITLGTLFAILLSTSDEMLPLFIAEQLDPGIMLGIVGMKVVIGMIVGFALDGALRLHLRYVTAKERSALHESATSETSELYSVEQVEHDPSHEDSHQVFSHHRCHNPECHCSAESTWKEIILSALKHTIEVSVIVYLISFALVAILEVAGEEALAAFLANNTGIAIFGAALVGLIPNCGASVVITQLYLDGLLGTGAMMSGLLVAAGVGLLVLFGENRHLKQNCAIVAGLYCIGVCCGFALDALGIAFM